MEEHLIEFVNTFDLSLKKFQDEIGANSGISNLTINQYNYIDAIYILEIPTITEIANKLNITKASVTIGIIKLIKMGYVIKTQSSEDKRVFHVSLTEAGKRLIKAKYQALKEYGEFISASLSDDEARQFKKTLIKLVNLFKQA
jgi:DNA-binding MarR family transcriptional regulator